jgi:hypothetical protein
MSQPKLTEHQRLVLETASRILSGVLAGRMAANPAMDMGSIRPHHVSGSVQVAAGLVQQVLATIPADD